MQIKYSWEITWVIAEVIQTFDHCLAIQELHEGITVNNTGEKMEKQTSILKICLKQCHIFKVH